MCECSLVDDAEQRGIYSVRRRSVTKPEPGKRLGTPITLELNFNSSSFLDELFKSIYGIVALKRAHKIIDNPTAPDCLKANTKDLNCSTGTE